MPNGLNLTVDLAIVCSTALTALWMLRRSIDRVARNRHTVFVLDLPFGITWMFVGCERTTELEDIIKLLPEKLASRHSKSSQPNALPHEEEDKVPTERKSFGPDN